MVFCALWSLRQCKLEGRVNHGAPQAWHIRVSSHCLLMTRGTPDPINHEDYNCRLNLIETVLTISTAPSTRRNFDRCMFLTNSWTTLIFYLFRQADLRTPSKIEAFIRLPLYYIKISWLTHAIIVHTRNTNVQRFSMFLSIRFTLCEGRDRLSLPSSP